MIPIIRKALCSDTLTVTILPERGAKLASILHRGTGSELLAQPPLGFPSLTRGIPFEKGDASGFDDVFPSMGEPAKAGCWPEIPDHGVVWTQKMQEESVPEGLAFRFCADGWAYRKTVRLEEDTIRLGWEIRNLTSTAAPCAWVCHGLWQLDQHMEFSYPGNAGEAVDVLSAGEPVCEAIQTPVAEGAMAKTYFSRPVTEGFCSCVWLDRGLKMTMRWDSSELPYLGFWITNGGWRGDRNFAFEPGLSYYDTLSRSEQSGTMRLLAPGECLSFGMDITVSPVRTEEKKER